MTDARDYDPFPHAPKRTLAEYLGEVRARADAATPGPWLSYRCGEYVYVEQGEGIHQTVPTTKLDNNFIAHARTDVPLLLAIIEEQAKALEEIMDVSGTSTLHYHTARDAQARVDALIAKGEK